MSPPHTRQGSRESSQGGCEGRRGFIFGSPPPPQPRCSEQPELQRGSEQSWGGGFSVFGAGAHPGTPQAPSRHPWVHKSPVPAETSAPWPSLSFFGPKKPAIVPPQKKTAGDAGAGASQKSGSLSSFFFWASPSSSPSSGLSSLGLQPPSGTHPVHRGQSRGSHSKQEDELNPGTPWYLFG